MLNGGLAVFVKSQEDMNTHRILKRTASEMTNIYPKPLLLSLPERDDRP